MVALLGCSGSREQPAPVADTATAAPATAAVPEGPGCRLSGLWMACSVEDRMVHAGLVSKKQDAPVVSDLFSVPGTGYDVGAGDDEVQVFLYESEAARRVDTEKLDSAAVSPKGEHRSYKVLPLLVTSNNLAALVFTMNPRSQERMANALSAGLPQPKP
jgi:hypothetical protein